MTKAEREVYEKTNELYNGCCALCGSPRIEMHHIRYGACGRKTYLGNVIPLCKEHHMEVHSNKKKWQPVLIEMIDEKIRSDVK